MPLSYSRIYYFFFRLCWAFQDYAGGGTGLSHGGAKWLTWAQILQSDHLNRHAPRLSTYSGASLRRFFGPDSTNSFRANLDPMRMEDFDLQFDQKAKRGLIGARSNAGRAYLSYVSRPFDTAPEVVSGKQYDHVLERRISGV